jgi:YHS domain-containing protein
MVRFILLSIVLTLVLRAVWRLISGIVEGASGPRQPHPPVRGVPMVRDPICGTFVVPSNALKLGEGGRVVYFCSERCLAKYRARA